jgi:hypothetical protein
MACQNHQGQQQQAMPMGPGASMDHGGLVGCYLVTLKAGSQSCANPGK